MNLRSNDLGERERNFYAELGDENQTIFCEALIHRFVNKEYLDILPGPDLFRMSSHLTPFVL